MIRQASCCSTYTQKLGFNYPDLQSASSSYIVRFVNMMTNLQKPFLSLSLSFSLSWIICEALGLASEIGETHITQSDERCRRVCLVVKRNTKESTLNLIRPNVSWDYLGDCFNWASQSLKDLPWCCPPIVFTFQLEMTPSITVFDCSRNCVDTELSSGRYFSMITQPILKRMTVLKGGLYVLNFLLCNLLQIFATDLENWFQNGPVSLFLRWIYPCNRT